MVSSTLDSINNIYANTLYNAITNSAITNVETHLQINDTLLNLKMKHKVRKGSFYPIGPIRISYSNFLHLTDKK